MLEALKSPSRVIVIRSESQRLIYADALGHAVEALTQAMEDAAPADISALLVKRSALHDLLAAL
jgi:hypothetical protein